MNTLNAPIIGGATRTEERLIAFLERLATRPELERLVRTELSHARADIDLRARREREKAGTISTVDELRGLLGGFRDEMDAYLERIK